MGGGRPALVTVVCKVSRDKAVATMAFKDKSDLDDQAWRIKKEAILAANLGLEEGDPDYIRGAEAEWCALKVGAGTASSSSPLTTSGALPGATHLQSNSFWRSTTTSLHLKLATQRFEICLCLKACFVNRPLCFAAPSSPQS